jgi:serine phosphatase RsbU (regulator of sigma subunit)
VQSIQLCLEQGGLIIGAFEDGVYDQGEIDLRPEDRLVFTDGLSEAVDGNGTEFGDEGLAEAARSNRQLAADALHLRLLDRVTDFCGAV